MSQLAGLSLCFDLDGTLVDTAPDLVRVLNTVTAQYGIPPLPFNVARNQVGFGAGHLIRTAYKAIRKEVDSHQVEVMVEKFLDIYGQNISELSRPFPGVIDTLRILKTSGAELSVCTNKPGFLARPLLEELGMTRLFNRVIGSGEGVASKPRPDMIFAAAGHRRIRNIVMIGDTRADIFAAQAACVPVVALAYGYADEALETLRPTTIIRRFGALPKALSDINV